MTRPTLLLSAFLLSAPSYAQPMEDCRPGDEFCEQPGPIPPCYRAEPGERCNPECNCHSPGWPYCDPDCRPGERCDPDPTCPDAPPPDTCYDEFLIDHCAPPPDDPPPPRDDCYDEFGRDICRTPPPPCEGSERVAVDYEGPDELFVLRDSDPHCGVFRVTTSGYYELFDEHIAESCTRQLDETGFLTVENSCIDHGMPLSGNAHGGRYVVEDVDNTTECSSDADCSGGNVCRVGTRSSCCVPSEPIYLGTFYLEAGEDNRVCLNHWCPYYLEDSSRGFANEGCEGSVNSIHVKLDGALFLCPDDGAPVLACGDEPRDDPRDPSDPPPMMTPDAGAPDPGRVDRDGDGFGSDLDCNDSNPYVSPAAPEVCGDLVDNDCDGYADPGCEDGVPDEVGASGAAAVGGCGCTVASRTDWFGGLPLLLVLALRRRRVR